MQASVIPDIQFQTLLSSLNNNNNNNNNNNDDRNKVTTDLQTKHANCETVHCVFGLCFTLRHHVASRHRKLLPPSSG
jgi:hypothetical protein